jgi:citrate synthase
MIEPKWLAARTEDVKRADSIDPQLYQKYNVKRGLRNSDGTGVLVGLTTIGNVHGYYVSEGEKVAIPGQLFYRGVDVEDIVHGCSIEHRFGFEETAYLLLFGSLPSKTQLDEWNRILGEYHVLPSGMKERGIMRAPGKEMMNALARAVLMAYTYDSDPDSLDMETNLRQSIELIA